MVNTSNWDKFSKRMMLGLVVSALVAAFFLLLGIYIVGAKEAMSGTGCEPQGLALQLLDKLDRSCCRRFAGGASTSSNLPMSSR
jgi:hypothetical protein